MPGETHTTVLATITRDRFGRTATMTNGIGITRTFSYNTLGELATTVDHRGSIVLQTLSYTRDPDSGNMLTLTRQEGNVSATQTYTYDLQNNLTRMTCSATGKPDTPSDLCPRETALSGSNLTRPPIILSQHYLFDQWNNIQAVTEKLMTEEGKQTSKTVTYTYAGGKKGITTGQAYDPHRMIAFVTRWKGQTYSTLPKTITYDALGRIITDADGNKLHYNAFGQQDRFTNAQTGEVTCYRYDSDGHQVSEQPFNAERQPLQAPLYMEYSGNTIVAQVQEGSDHRQHTSVELGGVAHSEDGQITRWYLHDYKGDVLAVFGASGEAISDNVYSPYGMEYDRLSYSQQALPRRLVLKHQLPMWQTHQPGFDNQMTDPATGYQFPGGGYRAYNPVYRHFMARDSFSPFTKIDGYGFGDNNPIMNTDPTGHMPQWEGSMLGVLGIVMNITLGFLMPVIAGVSAIGTGSLISALAGTAVISGILGTLGVTSGSLQIAAAAHPLISGQLSAPGSYQPENKNLAIANQTIGIINGFTSMLLGVLISSIVWSSVEGFLKLTRGLTLTSGISTFLYGSNSMLASIIGAVKTGSSSAATSQAGRIFSSALGYMSMALMTVSAVTGACGLISAGMSIRNTLRIESSEIEEIEEIELPQLPPRLNNMRATMSGSAYEQTISPVPEHAVTKNMLSLSEIRQYGYLLKQRYNSETHIVDNAVYIVTLSNPDSILSGISVAKKNALLWNEQYPAGNIYHGAYAYQEGNSGIMATPQDDNIIQALGDFTGESIINPFRERVIPPQMEYTIGTPILTQTL